MATLGAKTVTAIVLGATALWVAAPAHAQPVPTAARGVVVRVIDAETLEVRLADRTEIVRHIGIRVLALRQPGAPDSSSRKAAAAHAELVDGRDVTLQSDVAARNATGQLLAHVVANGRLVSAELVRRGFAEVYTAPPNMRHRQYLRSLQVQAMADRAGLWADPETQRLYRPARSGVIASRRTMSFFHVDDEKGWYEDSRQYFESAEAALEAGYVPSFEYAFHSDREARQRVIGVPAEPTLAASVAAARAVVLTEPAPAPALGHIWRGGVFIPIRSQ